MQNNNTSSLIEIPFHTQTISAQQDNQGTVLVALKPVCENLGLDYSAQYRRLQRQDWAVVAMMATTGADGKTYEMVGIDRQTFVMWLATIDTNRIKSKQARQLIVLYQREAAQALDNYFTKGIAIRVTASPNTDLAEQMIADPDFAIKTFTALKQERAARIEAEQHVKELAPKAEALDDFTNVDGSYSVKDAAALLSNRIGVMIGRNRLFDYMHGIGWIYRDPSTRVWVAYQAQIENGRLIMKAHVQHGTHSNGTTFPYPPTLRVTAKGLAELHKRLRDGNPMLPSGRFPALGD